MKIAVIGSGGREHAIIKLIKKNPKCELLYAIPGNGGTASDAINVPIKATDMEEITNFCIKESIDYVIVAPDDPLVLGLCDMLDKHGIKSFGPNKAAAIIEGSKKFAKDFMKRHNIPTASYESFSNMEEALQYVENQDKKIVIKASGLALGKGVIISDTKEESISAIKSIMKDKKFGNAGNEIVIEEFLEGPEVSVLTFTDGDTVKLMISSMDHKRALDGDIGLNTGGMGVIAPNPYYTDEVCKECMDKIFLPTIKGLKNENRKFKGCLYFGLMLTKAGPKVIEYNARFGDPEAQCILPLLENDLLDIMLATTEGNLQNVEIKFSNKNSCTLVAASKGYPAKYDKGYKIDFPKDMDNIFIAGTKLEDGEQITCGGRVLAITETGDTLEEAIDKAYKNIKRISFSNMFYRKDIGRKALDGEKHNG